MRSSKNEGWCGQGGCGVALEGLEECLLNNQLGRFLIFSRPALPCRCILAEHQPSSYHFPPVYCAPVTLASLLPCAKHPCFLCVDALIHMVHPHSSRPLLKFHLLREAHPDHRSILNTSISFVSIVVQSSLNNLTCPMLTCFLLPVFSIRGKGFCFTLHLVGAQ